MSNLRLFPAKSAWDIAKSRAGGNLRQRSQETLILLSCQNPAHPPLFQPMKTIDLPSRDDACRKDGSATLASGNALASVSCSVTNGENEMLVIQGFAPSLA
jgi:hypothetical protein